MALVKNNQIIDDPWHFAYDEETLSSDPVVVSQARWQQDKETLKLRKGRLGIILQSDEDIKEIAEDLQYFELIALAFPTFMDGRPYSIARLLRERFGFTGEVRAVGNVLRDQLVFMQRCGFDAFEIDASDDQALADWLAATEELSVFYQPSVDKRDTVLSLRQLKRQNLR